jgi:hypothetical protein
MEWPLLGEDAIGPYPIGVELSPVKRPIGMQGKELVGSFIQLLSGASAKSMLLLGQRRCRPVAATDDADVAPKQTGADDYSNMLWQPQWPDRLGPIFRSGGL